MKQAIQFGAGNIGRGFMGAILEKSGWHVTFADVVEPIVDAINTQKHYTVHVLDHTCYEMEISNISAVNSAGPDIYPAIAQADLITTAVGPLVLPKIAVTIAKGIQTRKPPFENILDAAVEEYTEWDVERSAWKGELIDVDGLTYTDNLMACLERKLFTLNSGHAICAYLGSLKGYETIIDSVSDESIGRIVHNAMKESGEALIKEFNFDPDTHHAYVERIFRRLQNPMLKDEVKRVGREPIRKLSPGDRLIKPLTTAASYGLPVDHFSYGAAAALRFDCADDPQSVELLAKIAEVGVGKALTEYSGLEEGSALHDRILEVYRALGATHN